MDSDNSKKLAGSMRKLFLRVRGKGELSPLEMSPGCPFGALVEERLRSMERETREVKGRINGLIFLLIALVVAELLLRIF
ncbi:MAG: hypothetical protein KAW13_02115 [Dehalococcoidia bacterium]|nr:hypothetical protein [Dehalococcoidia bacterium]